MYVNATFVCMGHMCIIVYICLFHVWLIHLPNTKASPKFEKKTTTKNPAEQRRAFSTMRKSSASQSACSTVILALQPLPPMPGRSSKITEKPFFVQRSYQPKSCSPQGEWYLRLSLEWSPECHFMSSSWQPMKKYLRCSSAVKKLL